MVLSAEAPHSLERNYAAVREMLAALGPSDLDQVRAAAFARFQAQGIPTTKHEEWKYTSLRGLAEADFQPAYGANIFREDLAETVVGKIEAATLGFVNGESAPEISTEQILPEGVVFSTLEDAYLTHRDLVLSHLGKIAGNQEGKLGAHLETPFVDLNTAYLGEGAFLYVPKNVAVEVPLQILFVSRADHGAFAAHPRVLILLEEGAQAKLIESFVGLEGAYFTNAVTEIFVAKGAHLEHTKIQAEASEAFHIATIQIHQEGESVFTSNTVGLGGRLARNDVNLWLNGEHTESWLNGVHVGNGDQVLDNHTRIDHAKPNCNSFEVYKSVLDDRSQGVFNGKIYVYEDAQKTDAKQTNKALLLSPHAQIDTKPQLEIFADDVKCTHGATVGQIREDAKFYFQSRGIPAKQAEALLVYAFAAEVMEKIGVPSAVEALEAALYAKLGVDAVMG